MTGLAAALQVLIGLAFVSIPVVRRRYGPAAKAAAEAEVERQGIPPEVLADHGIDFDERGIETLVPVAVAVAMTILAGLNFSAASLGETLTWIVQPLVLVLNAAILYSQVTATKSVTAYFAKTGDEALQRIDVKAMLGASEKAFPSWVFPRLLIVRHTIAFAGSIAVLLLLALD
jgi:hypothetical protein